MKNADRWWTVFAGAVGTGLGVGVFLIAVLGVLTRPLAESIGFDRSVISFALTGFLITTALGSVTLGILIHRFGVSRPAFAYLTVTVICVALIPSMPASPLAFYVLFAVMGVAGAASTALPYTVAIAGLFDRQRGLALAMAVAGGGVGGTLWPQLTNYLNEGYGWRVAFMVAAAMMAVPLLGLVFIVRSPPAVSATQRAVKETHWSLYLGKRAFWLIAAPLLAIAAGSFILTILVPLLTDRGLSATAAARVLSLAYFASLCARLFIGWLLDHVWAPLVASLVCAAACIGVLLIWHGGVNIPSLILGVVLLGMALGAEADLLTYLCSRYFSLAAFSRVVGSMWVVWAWGGGIGTAAAGFAYRATSSYNPALLIIAIVLAVGTVCALFLGGYAFPPQQDRVAAHEHGGAHARLAES